MRLLVLLLLVATSAFSQQVPFPKTLFSDSATYQKGVTELVNGILPVYKNDDPANYLNDLLRLHFARQDYETSIQLLDSLAAQVVPDKAYLNVPGFHYRVYVMTLLDKSGKDFTSAYNKAFNTVYVTIPDDGKEQVNSVFEKAKSEEEKAKFLTGIKKNAATDNISVTDAIELVKKWNYWQVYARTAPLAMANIKAYKEYEIANRENKLLGLDEGFPVAADAKTVITGVTLVDVEKQQLLPNTTVEITGDKISVVNTKGKYTAPAGATLLDGKGQYLIPGLTDAHIHFFQSGGLYTRPDGMDLRKYMSYEKEMEWNRLNMKDVLRRYVMNGITSVIDVGATNNFLQLRDKYKGKTFAPAVYMSGPLLTTYEPDVFKNLGDNEPFNLVATEEEGRKIVQAQLAHKPDLIKIWYILDGGNDKEASARKYLPLVKAIIDESHKNNVKVAVHATERIAAQLAAESGCDYLVHSVDDELIKDDFVKLLKDKKVMLCPTLTVGPNVNKTYGQLHNFSLYELRNANPVQLGSLEDLKHLPEQGLINNYKNSIRGSMPLLEQQDSVCRVNLKKLVDGGVRIAAGTDAGNPGTLHGTSLLPELLAMKKSGLSNWQLLQSATINPAYILNNEKKTGSVTAGKIADMVLLTANPVEDIMNLQSINMVINKGKLIKTDTLIKETALALVQRQLNAYNARNVEAFLEPYADDVELYEFPGKLISKGKEAMRKDYAFFKQVPDLHCEIKQRIVQGNIIIDKESVSGFGPQPMEATAIYHIEGNKIKKVFFIQ